MGRFQHRIGAGYDSSVWVGKKAVESKHTAYYLVWFVHNPNPRNASRFISDYDFSICQFAHFIDRDYNG